MLARSRDAIVLGIAAASAAACAHAPRIEPSCASDASLSCTADPSIVFPPEVTGPGLIRTTLRWLPERLRGSVPERAPDTFYVVESTPEGDRVVARGRCPGETLELPIAIAHDRDGTVHVLCIEPQRTRDRSAAEPIWPPAPARIVAHHGFARPGTAVSFTFDSRAVVATETESGALHVRPLLFSGFDGGGPYAIVAATFMAYAVKILRPAGAWAVAFRGAEAQPLAMNGCTGATASDEWNERLAAYALTGRTYGFGKLQQASPEARPSAPVYVVDPDAVRCVAPWPMGAQPTAVAEDESALVFRAGEEPVGIVAGAHAPSSVDAWPSSLNVVVEDNVIRLRKQRVGGDLWTTALALDEHVEIARASCVDTRCIVAVLARAPGRDPVLRMFRFDRPW